ncbi:MAG: PLP-dependent aminotransferase family protein [Spirochaetia bacterium]|jgi:2-aminoadipate transaminase
MSSVHRSFIREILKAAVDPEIISFAGGLPNPRFFPVRELEEATRKVLASDGAAALQYATTEGFPPLREMIAERYAARGTRVRPEEVLILNGSQQGLDLMAKVFLDPGDDLLVESPTYLAALQCFGFFEPRFRPLALDGEGVCTRELGNALRDAAPKLFYAIPNFQNPSGISYSGERRRETARLIAGSSTVIVEDDPYGEIRFMGEDLPSIRACIAEAGSPDSSVLLGTFSKIVSPGVRLGWIVAGAQIMEGLVVAKQAADLHSNELTQRIVHRYFRDNDVGAHIQRIRDAYRRQRDLMVSAVKSLFPPEVSCTEPEGGMFLWMTLPRGMSAMTFFEKGLAEKVSFVPGAAFFSSGGGENTLRLNFSNCGEAMIEEGMTRLARVYSRMAPAASSLAQHSSSP